MEKYLILVEYSVSEIDILKRIDDFLRMKGKCLQLTEHSFILATEISATELRDEIKSSIEGIQRVFVSKITPPAAWFRSMSENSSIKSLFNE